MKHFLEISQLSDNEIKQLLHRSMDFKQGGAYPRLSATMANLFYENSTRTRVSFELAAKRLGIDVINLDSNHSSESKGEALQDTIDTLAAMGISLFVIRHRQDNLPLELAESAAEGVHMINAGDGRHAHPSQALLDMMTICEQKPDLEKLKIAIVGDVRHSRVANSLQVICQRLQVGELVFISPERWQPKTVHYGHISHHLQEGLQDADVVICLRIQQERLALGEHLDLTHYHQTFGITESSIKWAKPDVMIMHPGPLNRGVELDSNLADGPRSYILEQVKNGVFMRMAILEALVTPFAMPA